MCTNVAQATTRAGAGGVGAPLGLFLARLFNGLGQPLLRILYLHQPNVPQYACGHHLAGMAHQRVTRVVVGYTKHPATSARQIAQRHRLRQSGGQWFVANHMETRAQKHLRHRRVHVVGGDDHHRVNRVRPLVLCLRHVLVAGVNPVRVQTQRGTRAMATRGIGTQRPGHQLVVVIQAQGDAVHSTDKSPLTPPDHAQAQSAGFVVCGHSLRHVTSFNRHLICFQVVNVPISVPPTTCHAQKSSAFAAPETLPTHGPVNCKKPGPGHGDASTQPA